MAATTRSRHAPAPGARCRSVSAAARGKTGAVAIHLRLGSMDILVCCCLNNQTHRAGILERWFA